MGGGRGRRGRGGVAGRGQSAGKRNAPPTAGLEPAPVIARPPFEVPGRSAGPGRRAEVPGRGAGPRCVAPPMGAVECVLDFPHFRSAVILRAKQLVV